MIARVAFESPILVTWKNDEPYPFFIFFFCSQDSRSLAGTEDKETFLVTLTKPCLYVQQVAFDKGENIKMI